ncbi:MAG TPA: ABC transporter substrate-binding protein [Armatimonadetes bacterium]|nr:ABC transporter substrate-binding protein [Armatimonadota bacterium]
MRAISNVRNLVIAAMVAAGFAVVCCGCAREVSDAPQSQAASEPLSVCVSIPPQAFLVEQIGGDRVAIEVLVGPGQSPATYDLTPAQMVALEDADVYFRIGVPFEDALMERISASMPDLNVVDLRDGIELQPISDHAQEDDGHGHGRMDPHTWLDPRLVAIQAETVRAELARLDPDSAHSFEASATALLSELAHVDLQIDELLRPAAGRKMLVFHPSFGYFCRAYGLEQVAIEVSGREPGPRELQAIVEAARADSVKAIFVQREFSDASARALAADIGARIVTLDPLSRDYIENMREMAQTVRDELVGPGGGE